MTSAQPFPPNLAQIEAKLHALSERCAEMDRAAVTLLRGIPLTHDELSALRKQLARWRKAADKKEPADSAAKLAAAHATITQLRKELADERAKRKSDHDWWDRVLRERRRGLTEDDLQLIRGCLHPDRPTRDAAQLTKAFQAFQKLDITP